MAQPQRRPNEIADSMLRSSEPLCPGDWLAFSSACGDMSDPRMRKSSECIFYRHRLFKCREPYIAAFQSSRCLVHSNALDTCLALNMRCKGLVEALALCRSRSLEELSVEDRKKGELLFRSQIEEERAPPPNSCPFSGTKLMAKS